MRTSLNDIKRADDFLSGKLPAEETVLFQVQLWLSPLMRFQVLMLTKVHTLVRLYGRKTMKRELTDLHDRIFSDPGKINLHQKLQGLFPEK